MAKGQKTCPKCKKNTGPRALKCECGHEFEFKKKANIVFEATAPQTKRKMPLITTPGAMPGQEFCPVRLKSHNEKDIKEWIEKLRDMTINTCGTTYKYATSAINYFVGDIWPIYVKGVEGVNPEFTKVTNWVKELCDEI